VDDKQKKRLERNVTSSELDLELADLLSGDPEKQREARLLRKLAKKRRRKIRRREDNLLCDDHGYDEV
jgi:hypothetical protein